MRESTRRSQVSVLELTHNDLATAIDLAIGQYARRNKEGAPYTRGAEICHKIRGYVDALYETVGARNELLRRAQLIVTSCEPGSPYESARKRARGAYRGSPKSLAATLARLRDSTTPVHLSELSQTQRDIERVLDEGMFRLSIEAESAYRDWAAACVSVCNDARKSHADGSWWLYWVHHPAAENSRAINARLLLRTTAGGAWLESVKDAATAMLRWAIARDGAEETQEREEASQTGDEHCEPGKPTLEHLAKEGVAFQDAPLGLMDDDLSVCADYRAGGEASGEPLTTAFISRTFKINKSTVGRKIDDRIKNPGDSRGYLYSWDCVQSYCEKRGGRYATAMEKWQRSQRDRRS